MSYTTLDKLKKAYDEVYLIKLSNKDGTTLTMDTAVISETITNVESLIDGFLRPRYNLPLTTVQPFLTCVANDLVYFQLKQRKNEIDEQDKLTYNNAIAVLKKISTGEIVLEGQSTSEQVRKVDYGTAEFGIDDVAY